MADVASKDENNVSSLLGVSNADGTSPVKIYASPTSHRLLVDGIGATGPTGPSAPTGATGATGPTGPSGISVANGVYTPVVSITVSGGTIIAIATA